MFVYRLGGGGYTQLHHHGDVEVGTADDVYVVSFFAFLPVFFVPEESPITIAFPSGLRASAVGAEAEACEEWWEEEEEGSDGRGGAGAAVLGMGRRACFVFICVC